jgi:N-acetyl-D-muramate 6-phosphate phosphatase
MKSARNLRNRSNGSLGEGLRFAEIRGWLFDLDGTLMDTDDQAVERFARRLRVLGEPAAHRVARRLVMMGETPMNHALTLIDMLGLDSWVFAMRRRLSHQVKPTFRLIEGIEPLLAHLAAAHKLAVVSTRTRQDALLFLDQHNLAPYFDLIVTQETTHRLKPHPQPVLYAAQHLQLLPSTCVMVGDTPVDVLSARRAGAWAIGVLCGFGEERELWRAGAHMIVRSTAGILGRLDQQQHGLS